MKAVVLHAAGDLRLDELPEPEAGQGEVVVRVDYGGVCGSDLHYWRHGSAGTSVLREPLVLGHEAAGTVAAVGPGADGIETGTPVTVYPATTCGRCRECRSGRENLCPGVSYLGSAAHLPHTPGIFSRYRAVPAAQLRVLPDGLDTRRGAVAEPLAVALHAVSRAGDVAGRHVLVNGAGPIGCLAVAAARAAGAERVTATDLAEPALAIAAAMGATGTVHIGREELSHDVDVCIEASGAPAALGACLAAVRRGGVVVQVGNLPVGPVTAELAALVSREIDYRGSFRFHGEITRAVELLAGGLPVEPLLTATFPASEAAEAFGTAVADPGKVLLDFRGS